MDNCSSNIIKSLIFKAGGLEEFIRLVRLAIELAIEYILDGRVSLEDLTKEEKIVFGLAFERRLLRLLDLPPNTRFNRLDTVIDGVDVDIKTTLGGRNWMIPKEGVGAYCLCLRVDYKKNQTFEIGVIRMDSDLLNTGKNRDRKVTLKAEHFDKIEWIVRGSTFTYNGNYHHAAALPKIKNPRVKKPSVTAESLETDTRS